MALNISVPLPSIGGMSSMSPMKTDCWDNIKMMVSPIGSESSGVSSLDSEDIKITPTTQKQPEEEKKELRIHYNGRNVLDLYSNLETKSTVWNFRYSHLPERNNISMFWANRSLYNRLGPNGLTPVYTINKCECCDFQFTSDCPNSYLSETSLVLSSTTSSQMMFTTATSKKTEFCTSRTTASFTPIINGSSGFKHQQHLIENKNCPETIPKIFNNQNKLKLCDIFPKSTTSFPNNNGYLNNLNKLNNSVCNNKSDFSQLVSNTVSINLTNSTSYTPPLINYGNNIVHNQDFNETNLKTPKSNVPNNLFNNNSLTLTGSNIAASANYNFQDNNVFYNNVPLSHTHLGNSKTQSSSSNNLLALFNSNNTNNPSNHAFSANMESSTFINSFNSINNNRNIIGTNLPTMNSQNYGRMYKYF